GCGDPTTWRRGRGRSSRCRSVGRGGGGQILGENLQLLGHGVLVGQRQEVVVGAQPPQRPAALLCGAGGGLVRAAEEQHTDRSLRPVDGAWNRLGPVLAG